MTTDFAPRNVGRESWRHRVRRASASVVLASGGLDSCALIGIEARRGREVFPLFVESGLIWETRERSALRRFLAALPESLAGRVRPVRIIRVPTADLGGPYANHWSRTGRGTPGWHAADNEVYIPGRNILLLSKAAVFAALEGIPRVAIGPLAGSVFPDATPAFFRAFSRGLAEGLGFPIRVTTPLSRMTKSDLIRRSRDLPLHLTFSCSRPKGRRHCGACAKCRERILAFEEAGVEDRATASVSRTKAGREASSRRGRRRSAR